MTPSREPAAVAASCEEDLAASGDIDPVSEEFQAARATCAGILEAARPELDPVAQQERLEDEFLLLAQCLRENGYPAYPDPALDE